MKRHLGLNLTCMYTIYMIIKLIKDNTDISLTSVLSNLSIFWTFRKNFTRKEVHQRFRDKIKGNKFNCLCFFLQQDT